jgi:hypothetical protein
MDGSGSEAKPASDPSAAPAWRPRHEAAVAVHQINATVLDGRIWVAGGLTPSIEATASTQVYDLAINSWEQGPPLPEPVHHAMLVTYRNQLVVIGGFHSRDTDLLAVTSPRMLLLHTNKWVDGPPLHHPPRRRRRRRCRRQDRRCGRTHRQPRAAGHPDGGL